jgi:hypothetical protein
MASTDGFWSSRKREKNLSPVEKPRKRRRPLLPQPVEKGSDGRHQFA